MWQRDTRKQGLLDSLFGGGGGASTGGFFGSGGKTTSTNQYSETNTAQNTIDANEGAAIAGGSNNVINYLDPASTAAAFELGHAALEMGRDGLDTAAQFAGRAGQQVGDIAAQSLANSRDALRDSLDFGDATLQRFADFGDNALQYNAGVVGDAINGVSDVAGDALSNFSDLAGGVTDFASGAISDFADFARGLFGDAVDAQQKVTDANLTGLSSLAMQTSASSDDRVQKVAIYAIVAVVVALVLPRVLGKP